MDKTQVPDEILCAKTHEYFLKEGDAVKVGITDYAVEQLGDIVFVELPDVNSSYSKGEVFGTLESVKAASEVYMPVSGKVIEINEKLITNPESVNEDCYGEGWLIKVAYSNPNEFDEAMEYDDYLEYLEKEEP